MIQRVLFLASVAAAAAALLWLLRPGGSFAGSGLLGPAPAPAPSASGPRSSGAASGKKVDGSCARCASWCPGTAERPVLVVGAGISGVAAAAKLKAMGCPVKVIEAKAHVGGRTYGEVQEGGWTFNHGANWIHGAYPNPIWALNQEHHIFRTQWLPRTYYARTQSGVVRDGGNDTYIPGEAIRDDFDDFVTQHSHLKEFVTLTCQGKFNSRDLPYTYYINEYLSSQNMSGLTLDEFLLYFNVYETLDDARDLYTASLVGMLSGSYNRDREYMVAEPYNRIVEFLAKDLDVRTSEPVNRIEYDDSGVQVHTRTGKIFKGSVVIVTIPLGVLQTPDVTFQPPLPPWKQRAIFGLSMGLLEKIAFVFDTAWWESAGAGEDAFWMVKKNERNGFRTTASEWYNLHNLFNKSLPPVLLTTPGGYFADLLEFASDSEVIDVFLEELQAIFPHVTVPRPRRMLRTRHRQDEFMRGSYLSPEVGTDPLSMAYLAEGVGRRVYFAGEATSTIRYAYVDGAYNSGLRAAREVLQLCSNEDSPIPMDRESLVSAKPADDLRIRREWRAAVESTLEMTIPNCDVDSERPSVLRE